MVHSKLKKAIPPLSEKDPIWLTELSDEELYHAIYAAKRDKHFALKDQHEKEAKIKQQQDALKPWTYIDLLEYALLEGEKYAAIHGKEFQKDKPTYEAYDKLALYFTNDARFEQLDHDYKLWKGLLVMGDPGVGKTDLLKSFSVNKRQPFYVVSCEEIEGMVRAKGEQYLNKYLGYVPGHGNTVDTFYKPLIWCFDDLGRDKPIFQFDCMARLIHEVYRFHKTTKGNITLPHISTNYDLDQLAERYDYTVVSRLKELYNIIILKGEDRRDSNGNTSK
jgi:hypothetical protein